MKLQKVRLNNMNLLWLFLEFFKIGICAFGGGLATIPFLEELSQTRGWFTLDQLADMIANGADMTAINSIQSALDEAVENLNKLEGEKEAIEQKLVDAENDRVNKITELTPSNVDEEEDDDADAGITPVAPGLTVVTLEPAAVPLAAAPVAGGAAVAGAVAEDGEGGNGGVVIEDNDTPLAGDIEDTVDAVATTIEDGETPLAAAPVEKMSWWWLLIVALLGATGYEMYRKHQAKKAELTETDK